MQYAKWPFFSNVVICQIPVILVDHKLIIFRDGINWFMTLYIVANIFKE